MPAALLEFQNVTIQRQDRVALDGLTLSIGVDEHVAILGPNGSGKSTLIKALTRECYPLQTPGASLRILGEERWNIFDLRPLLGVVTADLIESCTCQYSAREVILSGFFGSIGIWPNHAVTPAMEAKCGEILERLQIAHLAGRRTIAMSTGEARRVVLGRALVHDPMALVLDEPANSLDFHAAGQLRETMRKLAQSGTSLVLVTHHLGDIIPEIERVILLKNGRVFRDGPKQEVLTAECLGELFGSPVELLRRDGYFHIW